MNFNKLENIILKPIVTEKTLVDQANGKYWFLVKKEATKGQISQAFEIVFSIKPLSVNTLKLKTKTKTDRKTRQLIKKADKKKAVVVIPKDKKIELLNLKVDKN